MRSFSYTPRAAFSEEFLNIYIRKNTIILVDQLYASLQIIVHSTYCQVVPNCFLLIINSKRHFEPVRHRRLFQTCFRSVLILLDMMEDSQINLVLRSV